MRSMQLVMVLVVVRGGTLPTISSAFQFFQKSHRKPPSTPAAADPPSTKYKSALLIPYPSPLEEEFQPSIFDDILLSVFRWTLQQQSDQRSPDVKGFDGMVKELLDFRQLRGLEEQEKVAYQTMIALSGPVPFIYKTLFANNIHSPAILAWFAKHLLPFLVGDMQLTSRSVDDDRAGGVLVERCRVLEGTQCKGVCAKMCKLPTQRFFEEEWGVPLYMQPNFETGQCQLAFGVVPPSIDNDPTIPSGCITRCPAANFATPSTPFDQHVGGEQNIVESSESSFLPNDDVMISTNDTC